MSAADLSTAVQARINSKMLINLTNDDGPPAPTTVNTTRLLEACKDAIGKFEMLTGIAHDTTIYGHVAALITGVLYYLELYKSREGALVTMHGKQFFAECKSIREIASWIPVTSNSKLSASSDANGALPDMDRSRNVFNTAGSTYSTKNVASFDEEDV